MKKACLLFWIALFICGRLVAQDVGDPEIQKVIAKEWSINFNLNTSGFGFGFQHGRTPNHWDKHFWEIDFNYNKHHKAVRAVNPYYAGATGYAYGKLCDLFFLSGGYGYQRILNQKPYWGGVKVRYTLSGGFTLGMAMPVYVYVIYYNTTSINKVSERYDPDVHSINDIVGRGPWFQGFLETKLHPGFYVKTGFNFDFSKKEETMHALEVGARFDMVFPFVKQMAFNRAKPFFLVAYLSYNFGKRKGIYE